MKTLFLTGAGRGVGAALADLLSSTWNLILLARSEERGANLQSRYPNAQIIVGDLANPEEVARTVDDADLFGDGLDGFVCCAGIEGAMPLGDVTDSFLRDVYSVNVLSPILLTRTLLPALRQSRGTSVLVGSTAADLTFPGWLPYSSSKAALVKAASVLRVEERGIRVSVVNPGRIDTDMQRDMATKQDREFDPSTAMSPQSVAWSIAQVLEAPADVVIDELTITPFK